jgi:hypothetical protein
VSPTAGGPNGAAQAWIELVAEDPEAVSAREVARARLAAGRGLESLRRLRVIEILGPLPDAERTARLLHESTQFYNPHKERCTLRTRVEDPARVGGGDVGLAVWDRGGARRPAAERWWRHETGATARVSEATVWVMRFAPGVDAESAARDLGRVRDARHGLFCNPFAQEMRAASGRPPMPWIDDDAAAEETT